MIVVPKEPQWRPFEISRETVKSASQHPDRERRRSTSGPGEENCAWCHGSGNVRSSIDIRQGPCPCVDELDALNIPVYDESMKWCTCPSPAKLWDWHGNVGHVLSRNPRCQIHWRFL